MRWTDVDGLRLHLSDGRTKHNAKTGEDEPAVSRKTIYGMVAAGMKVAPRGDGGQRFWFAVEWADAISRAARDAGRRAR